MYSRNSNRTRCFFPLVLALFLAALTCLMAQQSPVMAAAAQDTEIDRRIKDLDKQVEDLERGVRSVEEALRAVSGGRTYVVEVSVDEDDPEAGTVLIPMNRAQFEEWATLEILSGDKSPQSATQRIRIIAARSKLLVPRFQKRLDNLRRNLKVAKDTRHKLIVQRAEGSSSSSGAGAGAASERWLGDWYLRDPYGEGHVILTFSGSGGTISEGKQRVTSTNRKDPIRYFNCRLEGNVLTGDWVSDPLYDNPGASGAKKGVRKGTFTFKLITAANPQDDRLEATAQESRESEIHPGASWGPVHWTRKKP